MNHCLDPEVVIQIDREHVAVTGEPHEVVNRNGLLGALGRPLATFDGYEVFPTVVQRVGALLDGLAQAHPFRQGNKRTAWDPAITYLGTCGMGVEASDDDATEFVLGVVVHEFDAHQAAVWFADRVVFL
ncbi:MAG TPA: Fic family protein [Cellulomonas sp.]